MEKKKLWEAELVKMYAYWTEDGVDMPRHFFGRKKPRAKLNPRGGRMPLITGVAPTRRGANRSTNCLIKEKGTPSGPGLELEVPKIIFLKSLTVGLGGALWILLS